ncbi:MAG: hypothetical protein K8R88_06065 [Armatimonadetes bacterium]|nr:hypothetical protein [Armatimonadota bacterium]
MKNVSTIFFVMALIATANAGAPTNTVIMMPDSTNSRLVLLDPTDGHQINSSYFGLTASTTPVHAMQVGNEIWISEQIGDKVSRWSLTGFPLGAISGGLDNIRGMGKVGSTVYVTNAGTSNGAPGNGVVTYSTSGTALGFFATPNAPSPFGILDHQGGLLVSSSSANDDIHKYTYAGVASGTFHNSASLAFVEQMVHATNGDVLAANFTTGGVARLNPTTGAVISSFTAGGARGVWQLGNGNILWSGGAGASVYDVTTGVSTLVYNGAGRYFDLLTLPPTVSGHFNFNGGIAQTTVNLQFRLAGTQTNVGNVISAPVDGGGNYSVSAPGYANYDLTVEPKGYLRRTINTNATTTDVTNANFNLVAGDIVDDNTIDLSDYIKLVVYFNASSFDINWNTPDVDGIAPSDADIDGNSVVDLTDYTVIVTNFNIIGDN